MAVISEYEEELIVSRSVNGDNFGATGGPVINDVEKEEGEGEGKEEEEKEEEEEEGEEELSLIDEFDEEEEEEEELELDLQANPQLLFSCLQSDASNNNINRTSKCLPHDEVLCYLLQEYNQQPLELLTTVINFLWRETDLSDYEGLDGKVLNIISATKRRRQIDSSEEEEEEQEEDATDDHQCVVEASDSTRIPEKIGQFNEECNPCVTSSPSEQEPEDDDDDDDDGVQQPGVEEEEEILPSSATMKSVQCSLNENNSDNFYSLGNERGGLQVEDVRLVAMPAEENSEGNVVANFQDVEDDQADDKRQEFNDEGQEETSQLIKPNSGDGADLKNYSWTQTLSEITLIIPVPIGTKPTSVICEIKSKHLKAGLKLQSPLVEGELSNLVKPDDCFWSIEDGRALSVLLAKQNRMAYWKNVIEGDPIIDIEKVEPENSKLSDLDAETRQTVEKMMYNQQQNSIGLLSGDEAQEQDIYKRYMSKSLQGLEIYL